MADEVLPEQPEDFTRASHVHVELIFVVRKAKTSKLTRPHGDIDNYCKSILDAMTKKQFWKDDVDITHLIASKRFAEPEEEPHTAVLVKRKQP